MENNQYRYRVLFPSIQTYFKDLVEVRKIQYWFKVILVHLIHTNVLFCIFEVRVQYLG